MESQDLVEWLARSAGPSIRYRTMVDLQNEQDVGVVAHALERMISNPPVQDWLSRFHRRFDINGLHSGNPDAYENVMGKCVLLGLRAGLQPFDSKTIPFRNWLAESIGKTPEAPHAEFLRTIVASFLAYAGYAPTGPTQVQMNARLDALYAFAKRPDFDSIFVDKSTFRGVPKSSHDLVNPELYPDQKFQLPWVHDIRGLAFSRSILSARDMERLNKVVSMILNDEYQRLPQSYGLAKYGRKYYVLGWAVHLPGYYSRPEGREFAELLLTLEYMAGFSAARESTWFRTNMDYLETFKTEQGTYLFPRLWMSEQSAGYWVGGVRMALDDRSSSDAIEHESTFWVLRIKRLAGLL